MGYDCGDRFPFDFEPNGIPFVQNLKEICHHDHIHIPFNLKGIGNIVFSVYLTFPTQNEPIKISLFQRELNILSLNRLYG